MNEQHFTGADYFWMAIILIVLIAIWVAIIYGVFLIVGIV